MPTMSAPEFAAIQLAFLLFTIGSFTIVALSWVHGRGDRHLFRRAFASKKNRHQHL
jgi:hypothetical protein